MKRAGCVKSEPLPKKKKTQDDKDDRPRNQSKLPQLPPVLLQKIASMLSDVGERLQFRDRIRFSSISRQMNVAVRGSIDRMQRRRVDVKVCVFGLGEDEDETDVDINDVKVKDQSPTGYTQTEHIDALLAFGRPNEINIVCIVDHRYCLLVVERILASTTPNSILRLYLDIDVISEVGAGTPFYGMLTSIGKMVNLEWLRTEYSVGSIHTSAAAHKNSSPSLPRWSPFLQLIKLEKLRALHVADHYLLTAAQQADLINRSSSSISHICLHGSDFDQLMASLNDRSRANITNACCLDELFDSTADQLQLLVERLPQCTNVSAFIFVPPDRQMIDQMGGRLLESVIALDNRKKMTVCVEFCSALSFEEYQSGQTEFTYKHKSTIVQVLLVPLQTLNLPACPLMPKSIYDRKYQSLSIC